MAKNNKRNQRAIKQLKAARNAKVQKRLKAQRNVKTEEWSSFDDKCIAGKSVNNLADIKCEPFDEPCSSTASRETGDSGASISSPTIKTEAVDELPQSNIITFQLPPGLDVPNVPYYSICATPTVSSSEFIGVIKKPHFDIINFKYGGKDLKRLVIYKPDDPSLCVEYGYNARKKVFQCSACTRQDHKVTAKVTEVPEPAVILEEGVEHVCCYGKTRSPQFQFNHDILKLPDAMLSDSHNGTYPLIVYTSGDQKLCYKYKLMKDSKTYYCIGCLKNSGCVSARVFIDSNDEYFVEVDGQKHICTPIAITSNEEYVVDPSRYEIDQIGDSDKFSLIVYTPGNRKYAYELRHHHNNTYYCYPCFKLCGKKFVHARKSQDGIIDTVYGNISHVCQPRLIPSSTFVNNIAPSAETLPTDNKTIIIDSTMLEIYHSLRRIIVFCKENRNYCYQLAIIPSTSSYFCIKCNEINHLCQPCAKLCRNLNDDYYLEAATRPHVCQPYPYSPTSFDKTIHAPNFTIYNRSDPNPKHRRVIVFASDDKKMFYEFVWLSYKWRCQNCSRQKKEVNVKIMVSDDGMNEEYLLLGKNSFHICEPQRDFAGIYSRNL